MTNAEALALCQSESAAFLRVAPTADDDHFLYPCSIGQCGKEGGFGGDGVVDVKREIHGCWLLLSFLQEGYGDTSWTIKQKRR